MPSYKVPLVITFDVSSYVIVDANSEDEAVAFATEAAFECDDHWHVQVMDVDTLELLSATIDGFGEVEEIDE